MEVFSEEQSSKASEKLFSNPSESPEAIPVDKGLAVEDTIEVSGITHADFINSELIKVYFESPKSGSNKEKEIKDYQQLPMGVVRIQFESREDAAAVVSQSPHLVYGMSFHVRFAPAPTSECIHPQFHTDRLLVSEIPPGVDRESFKLFLKKFTGIDEETCDFRHSLNGSITIVFKEAQSESRLDWIMEKIQQNPLKNVHIGWNAVKFTGKFSSLTSANYTMKKLFSSTLRA